jgi:hypothetical protein
LGDVDDVVQLDGDFVQAPAPVTVDGVTYDSYQVTLGADTITVNIEQEVTQTIV